MRGAHSPRRRSLLLGASAWALTAARANADEPGPDLIQAIRNLDPLVRPALAAMRDGRWMVAIGLFTQALHVVDAAGPDAWPARLRILPALGTAWRRWGRPEQAIPVLQEALAVQARLEASTDPFLRQLPARLDDNASTHLERIEMNRKILEAVRDARLPVVKRLEAALEDPVLEAFNPTLSLARALAQAGRAADMDAPCRAELARIPEPASPAYERRATWVLFEYMFFELAEVAGANARGPLAAELLARSLAMNWHRCAGVGTWSPSIEVHAAVFRLRRAQLALAIDLALLAGPAATDDGPAARELVARLVESKGLGVRHAERIRALLATSGERRLQDFERRWQAEEDQAPQAGAADGLRAVFEQELRQTVLLADVMHDLRRLGLGAVFVRGETILDALAGLPDAPAFVGFIAWSPVIGDAATAAARSRGRYLRYVIQGGRCQVRDLGSRGTIDHAVRAWRQALQADGAADEATDLGARLAGMLLSDLPQGADAAHDWVLDPDGALCLMPFEALPLRHPTDLLIERHAIRYCTAFASLASPARVPAGGPSQVFADPAYGAGPAASGSPGRDALAAEPPHPLPETRREAAEVVEALKRRGLDVRSHLGAQACAHALAFEAAPAYLHVAAHGVVRPEADEVAVDAAGELQLFRPGRSAAVLLGDGHDVQVVCALDLQRLRLQGTRLVVLSACDSGNGRIEPGEGVASLRRAVETAGARASITSLWAVPSEHTVTLMGYLYDALAQGAEPAAALHRAKQAARRAGLPAACWAAFVAAGTN